MFKFVCYFSAFFLLFSSISPVNANWQDDKLYYEAYVENIEINIKFLNNKINSEIPDLINLFKENTWSQICHIYKILRYKHNYILIMDKYPERELYVNLIINTSSFLTIANTKTNIKIIVMQTMKTLNVIKQLYNFLNRTNTSFSATQAA